MDAIASFIVRVLEAPADAAAKAAVRGDVHALTAKFPLYAEMLADLERPR
jgi:glycine/serine hydroxymethyltransferase